MGFKAQNVATLKDSFSAALATSIAKMVDSETEDDGNRIRMKDLATSLGISDSSASQRIRPDNPVPFKAFELLRLTAFFRKPLYEIVPIECFLTKKELEDKDLLMSIGFPTDQMPKKGKKQCLVSEEEEKILHDLRELSEEERLWLLEYFNVRKKC